MAMIIRRLSLVFTIPISMLLSLGCSAGASGGRIHFDSLKYPVSMSKSLYGPNKEILQDGVNLEHIKDFEFSMEHCSVLYSIVPLTSTRKISDQMNKEIDAAGGDGMTQVSFTTDNSWATAVPILHILPIWPGCQQITVSGHIVKRVP